jgi:N-acetylneuraminate synthase
VNAARRLGDSQCLIIGEVGLAHDGSLGLAHSYVDAIASAGADAVKFQTHIAAAESTPAEPFRVNFSRQDATRYEYWKRTEFTEDQWRGLAEHARQRQLLFLSSPFSIEAADLLARVGVAFWKIASGETSNAALLDRVADTGLPIVLSTGMSSIEEIDAAVSRLRSRDVMVGLLQCTTAYPCPPERIGLNMIPLFRERYGVLTGLSDHSGTIYAGLAAATLRADVLEVHVALSRAGFGPDIPASITPEELRQMVDGVRFIEKMHRNPVDKTQAAVDTLPLRQIFTKSVVARVPLGAGVVLESQHLAVKKPGTGIPAARLGDVIGRRLRRPVGIDEQIRQEDIE